MVICYYTKNGKIVDCHTGRGKSYVELLALAEVFNKEGTEPKLHIRVVDDNSLTAYLMGKCEANKDVINDIKHVLSNVEDMLNDICTINKEGKQK